MFLSCKCLNITIKIRDNCELKPIKIVNYHDNNHVEPVLSQSPTSITSPLKKFAGEFFQHDLLALTSPSSSNYEIMKRQHPLIYEKVVDNWTISRCINCLMYTHALNKRYETKNHMNDDDNPSDDNDYHNYKLLINNTMILPTDNSDNNVEYYKKLKLNVNYSKIYKIIVDKKFNNSNNNSDNDDDDDDDNIDEEYKILSKKKLSDTLNSTISHLQLQYEMGYQNMKKKIDEKIKKFVAEQYEFLDEFKERGYREYCLLAKKVCNSDLLKIEDVSVTDGDINKLEKFGIGSTEVVSTVDQAFVKADHSILSPKINKISSFEGIEQNTSSSEVLRLTPKEIDNKTVGQKELKKKEKKNLKNHEDEVIFPFEGMDDSDNIEISEDEIDTDDSGQDEGIHIPRGQRGGHPTLAKSLPVSVPNFSFGRLIQDQNEDQLSMDPRDPNNIRASIKALAKSVHGDTVFGDLPRPRFSTQI
ncbi:myb-like protein O [Chelonus insularis]|uniref:myb-like protein O n=1 Tax=Chelonus insularis TaxID=460826 RepID=UPI00158E4FAA|nr:myb-like protein O [Chelonus insularis]